MRKALARIGGDFWVALLLALVTTSAAFAFGYRHPHPSVWLDYAAGVGLHPGATMHPALWTMLARTLSVTCGPTAVLDQFPMIGRLLLGFLAGLSYWCVSVIVRTRAVRSSRPFRQLIILRVSVFVAIVALVTSQPVWTAAQNFSPAFLTFALLLVALALFQDFWYSGGFLAGVGCATCLGLAFADTPLVPFLALTFAYLMARRWFVNREGDSFRQRVCEVRWPAFFLAVVSFLTVFLGGGYFHWLDWEAFEGTPEILDFLDESITAWAASVPHNATGEGWVILIALSVGPLVGALAAFHRASDDEASFSYFGLIFYGAHFVFLILQFAAFGRFSIFSAFPARLFPGEFARLFAVALMAFSAAFTLAAILTEVFARRHGWKLDKQSNARVPDVRAASPRFRMRARRLSYCLLATVVFALFFVARDADRRAAVDRIFEYAAAVREDAVRCTDVCTDGRLDDAVRLASVRLGAVPRQRPMMSRGSTLLQLLQRVGVEDAELRSAADGGASSWLRTIVRDRPEMARRLAVQVGFEAWRFDLKPLPPAMGTLARFDATEAERRASWQRADALSAALSFKSPPVVLRDTVLSRSLDCVRWRLARMTRYRAEEVERRGDTGAARALRSRYARLNAANVTLCDMLEELSGRRRRLSNAMTPREALHMALRFGNYEACGVLASVVLESDPNHPEANFAMALSAAADDDYRRAEYHFRLCLKNRPKNPVLLNNLALTLLNMGRYTEAREFAVRASAFAPGVEAVRRTVEEVDRAIAIAATNGLPQKVRLVLSRDGSDKTNLVEEDDL